MLATPCLHVLAAEKVVSLACNPYFNVSNLHATSLLHETSTLVLNRPYSFDSEVLKSFISQNVGLIDDLFLLLVFSRQDFRN